MRLDQLESQATLLAQPDGSGTIVVSTDEAARYTRFTIAIQGLLAPKGSTTKWLLGNDIAENRNTGCANMEGDWVWFIDDDHVFAPTILMRLLDREVDIVTPICLRRQVPFGPIPCVAEQHMRLNDFGEDELVEVQHAGSSGMLIRRHVLEEIEQPWFELGNGISEDVNFCRKAVAAGFKIHVDLAVPLGHITTAVVWPSFSEGRWVTGLDVADGARLAIEQPESS